MHGRPKEGKETYAFFLDVQKAYDSVWCNGLWLKLWEFGVRRKMWRVIKRMYIIIRVFKECCIVGWGMARGI